MPTSAPLLGLDYQDLEVFNVHFGLCPLSPCAKRQRSTHEITSS